MQTSVCKIVQIGKIQDYRESKVGKIRDRLSPTPLHVYIKASILLT